MAWTDDIPFIVDGEDADEGTFNAPLQVLADRTDYLKDRLDSLTNKGNIVASSVAVASAVETGDLVYFDATDSTFKQAKALWSDTYIANGELVAAPSAYVRGVVLSKATATIADILLSGEYISQSIADHLFGAGAAAGLYYLSAQTAGRAQPTPPPLKVPVVTYTGGGEFIVHPPEIFQPNHLHRSHVLRKPWYPASDARFDGMDKPAWAKMGYDVDSDPEFKGWFASYPGVLAVFIDGLLQEENKVITTTSNIWWMGSYAGSSSSSGSSASSTSSTSESSTSQSSLSSTSSVSPTSQSSPTSTSQSSTSESSTSLLSMTSSSSTSSTSQTSESSGSSTSESSRGFSTSSATSQGITSSSSSYGDDWPNGASSIVAFSYCPMIAGEPVVRAVGTDTPCELDVKTGGNGVVKVNAMPWVVDAVDPTGLAVVTIVDKHLKVAPVVTSITSSEGITIVPAGNGVVDISTGDIIEALRDAELVNLNNAVELTDDPFFYYSFPGGRVASMLGKVAIPRLSRQNSYEIAAWAYRAGIAGATQPSPITFPAISVELTHVASPRPGAVDFPAAPQVSTSIAAVSTVEGKLYYGESPSTARLAVTSEGTAYVRLYMPSAAFDRRLTRFGVIIYLKAGTGPVVRPCGE